MLDTDKSLVLDACVVINLLATDLLDEILLAQGTSVLIAGQVAAEALFLDEADGTRNRVHPDHLPVTNLDGDEFDAFVTYATQLGDGEAATLAIAACRGFTAATDDRKALRLAAGAVPNVPCVDTPELIQRWVEVADPSPTQIQEALRKIEDRARYRPRKDHPLAGSWRSWRHATPTATVLVAANSSSLPLF
jgi:predicted nucleic acid-binding protein